jgi:hypothetical protein
MRDGESHLHHGTARRKDPSRDNPFIGVNSQTNGHAAEIVGMSASAAGALMTVIESDLTPGSMNRERRVSGFSVTPPGAPGVEVALQSSLVTGSSSNRLDSHYSKLGTISSEASARSVPIPIDSEASLSGTVAVPAKAALPAFSHSEEKSFSLDSRHGHECDAGYSSGITLISSSSKFLPAEASPMQIISPTGPGDQSSESIVCGVSHVKMLGQIDTFSTTGSLKQHSETALFSVSQLSSANSAASRNT